MDDIATLPPTLLSLERTRLKHPNGPHRPKGDNQVSCYISATGPIEFSFSVERNGAEPLTIPLDYSDLRNILLEFAARSQQASTLFFECLSMAMKADAAFLNAVAATISPDDACTKLEGSRNHRWNHRLNDWLTAIAERSVSSENTAK